MEIAHVLMTPPSLPLSTLRRPPPSCLPCLAVVAACRRIHDSKGKGVTVTGRGTKGRLESCDIARNYSHGVIASWGAEPTLVGCNVHDHPGSQGVSIRSSACGMVTMGPGNVFARNVGGDVVGLTRSAWGGRGGGWLSCVAAPPLFEGCRSHQHPFSSTIVRGPSSSS